jgi:hypothetical protein
MMKRSGAMIGMVGCAMAAASAQAQVPQDLDDLVGARAAGAEMAIKSRGYVFIKGEKGDDRSYTYWWNKDRGTCVSVATMDGRYASITPTTAPDCGKSRRDIRHSNRRPQDDRNGPTRRSIQSIRDNTELQSICRAEASRRYDLRPSELTVNAPIDQRNGSIVQGWFDSGKRTTFFNCRFDSDGRFITLM